MAGVIVKVSLPALTAAPEATKRWPAMTTCWLSMDVSNVPAASGTTTCAVVGVDVLAERGDGQRSRASDSAELIVVPTIGRICACTPFPQSPSAVAWKVAVAFAGSVPA